ncbi:hypothetical protein J1N35_023204 [Gossypium stocksii]|uniref:Uncharacterized protein n=1 Tax=Gossypium stocksii TaxID=47602 RepID=A0A9D3VHY1_9ROSI|nr:hypothetical protein J1N35_023204 [Gossypium stocksii]
METQVSTILAILQSSYSQHRKPSSWMKSLNPNDLSQAWKATSSLKGWWKLLDIRWAKDNVDGLVSMVEARAML